MTTNLHFRIATHNDAKRVQQLVESAFRAEDSRPNWTADMELGLRFRVSVNEVLATITHPDKDILLATIDNDQLIASVEISKGKNNSARLSMLAVDQNFQQSGLGRRVLAHAEEYCRDNWGVTRMELNALSSRQELTSWYIRRGYRCTGESTPFPREKFSDLKLSDGLCFVELEKDLRVARH